MLERIRTLLTARQLSPTQFADTIGVSRPIVSHILSGRNKPSLEVVQKIVSAFPDLSLPWLLNGEGAMLAVRSPAEPVAAPVRARTTVSEALATPQVPPTALAGPEMPLVAPAASVALPEAVPAAFPLRSEAVVSAVLPAAPEVPLPAPSAPAAAPTTTSAEKYAADQVVRASGESAKEPASPAGSELARSLATPGKGIRRIVIFYQDGTFADYQPEAAS